MKLSELKPGQSAIIVKILGHGAFRKRVIEMGFVKGKIITPLLSAPLSDPVKYHLMNYEVSLRLSEAALIEVVPVDKNDSVEEVIPGEHPKVTSDVAESTQAHSDYDRQRRIINVALIGNPNCGKTSLFNVASGSKEHTGNYSGVTVDAKEGTFQHGGYTFNIVDLPGTYSLSAYSPEELYVRRYLNTESPDVIVNVVDGSNLERNLYLTTELIDMDRSMVIALNMYDELEKSGAKLDYTTLGEMIGVPIVPTVSRTGQGVDKLFDTIIDVYEGRDAAVRHVHVSLGADIERGVTAIKDELKRDPYITRHFSPRYLAIKLLERDREVEDLMADNPERSRISRIRDIELAEIERLHDEDITSMIAAAKYGFISGALAETMVEEPKNADERTRLIDSLVTDRLFGFPIFLAIMFVIFWLTFALGAYPMEWIESAVAWLGGVVGHVMPDGPIKDMIADGVIGGVGGVIVFLPNIMILYLCLSIMEDSGYMARAAFIMDKIMHRIGLHGKSFIPLVMGFGCNVPAIMAARSIESRSSRIITVLINPFMSCSARLPIYVLLVGIFFPGHAALAFMGLYLLGVAVAVATARLLRRFMFKTDETPFVMELPPYRIPTMKASLSHAWWKGRQYLRKMGGVILLASIALWALNYFPTDSEGGAPSGSSYLAQAGRAVEPVMEPIGLDWRASVAALAGVPAKEIVVSTLGVLYASNEDPGEATLRERLIAPSPVTGKPGFTAASALAFMVFILLYCPCIATVTAIVRETGSWRWGAFSVVYNTVVAWVLAFAVYRIALLF